MHDKLELTIFCNSAATVGDGKVLKYTLINDNAAIANSLVGVDNKVKHWSRIVCIFVKPRVPENVRKHFKTN